MAPPFSVTCVMLTCWPRRAAMVQDALASFHAQDYPQRELLVVNEGAALRSTSPGVRVLNTGPRATLGAQRNLALRHAHGDLVANWDDDDASLPTRLSVQVEALREADLTYFQRIWVADAALRPVCVGAVEAVGLHCFRREVALSVGGYGDMNQGEDGALVERLRAAGRRLAPTTGAPVYVYRRHGGNVTGEPGGTNADLEHWMQFCTVGAKDTRAVVETLAWMRRAAPRGLLVPV